MYDKNRDIIATSVTNLELHDIARSCMTFGIELCYIVTPLTRQREISEKLIHHWEHGYGATYNPKRSAALKRVRIISDFNEMLEEVKINGAPIIIGTSSHERAHKAIGYRELRAWTEREERPFLMLFGTGWGLTDETTDLCEKMLIPIKGAGEYNHLSLRVALGIILDRIFGERGDKHERDD
ncbi:MAG: RNA methyltransferase [Proteobacteria bacterium]|nr:RNA methyltransferase [Pseudomonadota bacterium]